MAWRSLQFACLVVCLGAVATAAAQSVDVPAAESLPSPAVRQEMADAWWTGPMLANSAATLPRGHWLIEPYVYDIHSDRSDSYGSRAYVLYGLTDRLTVGMIPIVGYNTADGGPSSSRVLLGDFSVQAQYGLTQFQPGSWVPTTAIQIQETLPTGRYDHLHDNPGNALGSGAYATTVQFNAQTYYWMPNGRILRMRLNVAQTWARSTRVHGVSVYGTGEDFNGNAQPGNTFYVGLGWEYSVSRRWVLALDATYTRNRSTRVAGQDIVTIDGLPEVMPYRSRSGSNIAYGLAPAIEYNWSSNMGVLLGTRVIFGGHRTTTTITPAVALNMVF
ncbi:MAG TPA: transporter [Dyella sp.]|uniref:transporter n=1 Tax=Dyella sp. TaxID=1869338 RepID=UPI002F92871E